MTEPNLTEHQKMEELANRLLAQTLIGAVAWQAVDRDGTVFIYSAINSSVTIGPSPGAVPEEQDFELKLLNSQGNMVATLTKDWEHEEPWHLILNELYYAARDAALNVNKTFKDIFSSLEAKEGERGPRLPDWSE
jgi:hypothetical protein